MHAPKRPRLDTNTTTTLPVTPLNASPAQAGMAVGNQTIINQAYATAGGQAQTPAITLNQLPVELLLYIAHYLRAKDIIKLSHAAPHFHAAFSLQLDGSPLLQRSLEFIQYPYVYHKESQTLNLDNIIHMNDLAAIPQEPYYKTYQKHLGPFIEMLERHSQWVKSHIKRVTLPLTMLYLWISDDLLSKIFLLLGGVEHLHITGSSAEFPWASHAKKYNLTLLKILQNFKAFNALPAKKVTIENDGLVPITELKQTLFPLLTKGFFHPALESFTFIDADLSAPDYSIEIADGLAYPALTTMEFHFPQAPFFSVTKLPETVTCLHIHTNNVLQGRASSITRLEIHMEPSQPVRNLNLHNIHTTLPAIREIHLHTPDKLEEQYDLLADLAQLNGIAFSFSNLHVRQTVLLDKLLSTDNTVHLPHKMVFYPRTQTEVNGFKELASRKELHAVTHIQYQFDSAYAPAQDALQTLVGLLQQGALPRLRNFSFNYQFPGATIPDLKTSFLQNVESHFLFSNATIPFTLPQIISGPDFEKFLLDFTNEMTSNTTRLLWQEGKGEKEITAFTDNIEATLLKQYDTIKQHLNQKFATCQEWITEFEHIYFQLHGICLQQLREIGLSTQTLQAYQKEVTPFFTGSLDKPISSNIIRLLCEQYAKHLLPPLQALLAEAGLEKFAGTVTESGFSVHFLRKHPPAHPTSQQKYAEMISE